ncbi:MAG: XdhC family protein [Acidimicrobiales bacterium]
MSGISYELRETAERLRSDRRPFVTATVVRADKPTSAKPGDSAIVMDDGTVIGFVGGECAHTSVQVQALAALATGDPVLLRITPEVAGPGEAPQETEAGTVTVHNPCLSGGALEIFLEPHVPPCLVVVYGEAPIARAVRVLTGWLGFDTKPGGDGVPADADAVVIASHGGPETAIIRQALEVGVPYIGLIASPRRGAAVLTALDLDALELARVHTPAGIDIGCRTPEEVALSVLAEIVSCRPRSRRAAPAGSALATEPRAEVPVATDPVCHMSVPIADTTLQREYEGKRYFFCGPGCEQAFRADPHAFVQG